MKRHILITAGVRWWNASAHYAVDLARALSRQGHEVLVAARAGTPAAEKALEAGLDVDLGFDFRPRHLPRDMARMIGLLRRRPFDIINPHRASDQNLILAALSLLRCSVPVLRTRVDVKEFRPNRANVLVYGRLVQGIVTPGEGSRKLIIDHYRVPGCRVETVHGGVDTDRFTPERRCLELRRSLGVSDDRLAVGLVARLGRIKGHAYLFEAIARLQRNGYRPNGTSPVWLVIGQETDYTIPELQEMARAVGARDVIFTGFRHDIAEVTACLDIGVAPSVGSEAHCRVGLEMLASGVPVVGARVGVIPEIIDEDATGYVVEARDGVAIADRLERLLSSPDRLRAFARAARRTSLERFTFDAWAQRTLLAYERLINGRSPSSAPAARPA